MDSFKYQARLNFEQFYIIIKVRIFQLNRATLYRYELQFEIPVAKIRSHSFNVFAEESRLEIKNGTNRSWDESGQLKSID